MSESKPSPPPDLVKATLVCTCGAGSDEDCSGSSDHIPPCPASSKLEQRTYEAWHRLHLEEAARLLRESLNPAYDGDSVEIARCAWEQREWLKRDEALVAATKVKP